MEIDLIKKGKPPERLLKAARKLQRKPSKDNTLGFWRVSKEVLRRAGKSRLEKKADIIWLGKQGKNYSLGYQEDSEGDKLDFEIAETIICYSTISILRCNSQLELYLDGIRGETHYDLSRD